MYFTEHHTTREQREAEWGKNETQRKDTTRNKVKTSKTAVSWNQKTQAQMHTTEAQKFLKNTAYSVISVVVTS
jgi:hypothetical protein